MIHNISMRRICRAELALPAKSFILIVLFATISLTGFGQQHGFAFGEKRYADFEKTVYPLDTSANAIVLDEFGEAFIDPTDFKLNFDYHVKIKILKKEGFDKGNFEVILRKNGSSIELMESLEAVTYNLEDNRIVETALERKTVFTDDGEYWELKKFALPQVKVGSIIEVRYRIRSPFIMNFHPWEFQSDIPKLKSEYWARIPGNYQYNIVLKGFLNLTKNESTLVKECLTMGPAKADCALNKYAMRNIPAFIDEEYSTASSNFLASINFELTEIRYFDGRVDKVTKEWKDVDDELKRDNKFGVQLKKGKDIAAEIEQLLKPTDDDWTKANKVYDFIKSWYRWNGSNGKYSELGIRKAFDTKTGNVGDINLSLIAALRFAGLEAYPVVLSTRANGLVTQLHPVLSDFNYVIAKFDYEGKTYLLDATDGFMPFGLLPQRCLNGKGRVLENKNSYWIDITPADKWKSLSVINLTLEEEGQLKGTIQSVYSGYEAASQRKNVFGFASIEDYFKDLDSKWVHIELENAELENYEELDKPLTEKLQVTFAGHDASSDKMVYFNPFVIQKWNENPFKSNNRMYPVDFGYPMEWTLSVQLTLPENMELEEVPQAIANALPGNGGHFRYQVSQVGREVFVQSSLLITRPVFHAKEYAYLKELFSQVIQTQNIDLVFVKR